MKNEIQEIANSEARSISQVCEFLLSEGVQAYKKEGPKFMQRLVAEQEARVRVAVDCAAAPYSMLVLSMVQ